MDIDDLYGLDNGTIDAGVFFAVFMGIIGLVAVILVFTTDFEVTDPAEVTIESVVCGKPDYKGRSECQLVVRTHMPEVLSALEQFELPPGEAERVPEEASHE